MNIKKKADDLIKKFNTRNPFKIAKELKIDIEILELGDVRGFYKKILRKKVIFINSEMSEFEQKIVCGHELGHAVLHSSKDLQFMLDSTSIIRRNRLEDEANLFMKHLIFCEDECQECYTINDLQKLDYGVFEELMRL